MLYSQSGLPGKYAVYEGYWRNGKKEGKGRIINREGIVFEGCMKDG
jgi:hypothetical protein